MTHSPALLKARSSRFPQFLAATEGGTISIYGRHAAKRWVKLGATVEANPDTYQPTTIQLAETVTGWVVGDDIIITSTSYNGNQWERASISDVVQTSAGTQLKVFGTAGTFKLGLQYRHEARKVTFGSTTVDMSAEVAVVSASSVTVSSVDASTQFPMKDPRTVFGYERYGAQVVVAGKTSTAHLSGLTVSYCGQAGLERPCVRFLDVVNEDPQNPRAFLRGSSVLYAMDAGLSVEASAVGIQVQDNVLLGSFDQSTLVVRDGARRAVVQRNLALGTQKVVAGKSGFDIDLPATFDLQFPGQHVVTDNVAAGSDRAGFWIAGERAATCASGRRSLRVPRQAQLRMAWVAWVVNSAKSVLSLRSSP